MPDTTLPESVAPSVGELTRLRFAARELSLAPRRARAAGAGGHRSRQRGRGMEVDEVRLYQAGDDVRAIDWRVTARSHRPHTKVFREERERPVLLICDLRRTMFFGSRRLKSARLCELAAALAWAGLQNGDRIGALVFGPDHQRDLRARRSHHTVLQLLNALHEFAAALTDPAEDTYTLLHMLRDCGRVALPGAQIIIISDFHDLNDDCERPLFELKRHCDLSLIQIQDPLEQELPPPGLYPVDDGRGRHTLNTADSGNRSRFAALYQRQQAHLQQVSRRIGANLYTYTTVEGLIPALLKNHGKGRARAGSARQ